jgi:hypothetical protein
MIEPVIAAWVAALLYLVATPNGRSMLRRLLADVGRVLGFGPSPASLVAERWARAAALVADPADRRAAQVADAYAAGAFDTDELEWRILLALVPPPPDRPALVRQWEAQKAAAERMMQPVAAFTTSSAPWTAVMPGSASVPWSAAAPVDRCRFRDLHSGSGYLATICDCGHDLNQHYTAEQVQAAGHGGCNDCDAFRAAAAPVGPDPRLVDELEW